MAPAGGSRGSGQRRPQLERRGSGIKWKGFLDIVPVPFFFYEDSVSSMFDHALKVPKLFLQRCFLVVYLVLAVAFVIMVFRFQGDAGSKVFVTNDPSEEAGECTAMSTMVITSADLRQDMSPIFTFDEFGKVAVPINVSYAAELLNTTVEEVASSANATVYSTFMWEMREVESQDHPFIQSVDHCVEIGNRRGLWRKSLHFMNLSHNDVIFPNVPTMLTCVTEFNSWQYVHDNCSTFLSANWNGGLLRHKLSYEYFNVTGAPATALPRFAGMFEATYCTDENDKPITDVNDTCVRATQERANAEFVHTLPESCARAMGIRDSFPPFLCVEEQHTSLSRATALAYANAAFALSIVLYVADCSNSLYDPAPGGGGSGGRRPDDADAKRRQKAGLDDDDDKDVTGNDYDDALGDRRRYANAMTKPKRNSGAGAARRHSNTGDNFNRSQGYPSSRSAASLYSNSDQDGADVRPPLQLPRDPLTPTSLEGALVPHDADAPQAAYLGRGRSDDFEMRNMPPAPSRMTRHKSDRQRKVSL